MRTKPGSWATAPQIVRTIVSVTGESHAATNRSFQQHLAEIILLIPLVWFGLRSLTGATLPASLCPVPLELTLRAEPG